MTLLETRADKIPENKVRAKVQGAVSESMYTLSTIIAEQGFLAQLHPFPRCKEKRKKFAKVKNSICTVV